MTLSSLYVYDPDEAVTLGVRSALSSCPGIGRLGASNDRREALLVIAESQPDVIVIGDSLGTHNPFDTILRIRRSAPQCRVILYCHSISEDRLAQSLQLRVSGIVLRAEGLRGLSSAVSEVLQGRSYLPSSAADSLISRARSSIVAECLQRYGVADVDIHIVDLVSQGKSNREVAAELSLAEATVKKHLTEMFSRMAVPDRTALVMKFMAMGFI